MNALQARAAGLVLAALLLAGCAAGAGGPAAATGPGSAPASASGTATAAAAATITIRNFNYGEPVTVPPGAVVAVTNLDDAAHTVTSDQGSAFDVDIRGSGATATFTAPSVPGTYAYHCTYHPNMHGMLVVK